MNSQCFVGRTILILPCADFNCISFKRFFESALEFNQYMLIIGFLISFRLCSCETRNS
jgi:hypothetical protein